MITALQQYRSLLFLSLLVTAGAASYLGFGQSANHWLVEKTQDAGFVLSKLNINGIERTQEIDILANLDIDDGMPLLSIDLKQIQERIEALPWVKHAIVTRVLPGNLNIQIEERQPYALWQHQGKVRLIDETGTVITGQGLTEFSSLMLVVGDGGSREVGQLFEILELYPAHFDRIKTAVRVGDRRWDLVFDNGVRLKLPEDFAVDYAGKSAWENFVRLEEKHRLLEREVSVIDMRMEGRVVMRVTPTGRRQMDGKEWTT